MPLFSIQIHTLINQVICEMTEKGSVTEAMISSVHDEIINLLSSKPDDLETAILAMVDAMVGTLHGLAHPKTRAVLQWRRAVEGDRGVVLIVDEASQTSLMALFPLIEMLKDSIRGIVIVGDPRQLRQTTHSQPAPESLLDIGLRNTEQKRNVKLIASHRSDPILTRLWSRIFYQNQVVCALSAECRQRYADLRERLSKETGYLTAHPFALVNVDGKQKKSGKSYENFEEASLLVRRALVFLQAMHKLELPWLQDEKVWFEAVCVYLAQANLIKKLLAEAVKKTPGLQTLLEKFKVVTVDGSQGSEAVYTVICTTRTQPVQVRRNKKRRSVQRRVEKASIGYIIDAERMNVALSRGRCWTSVFLQLKLFEKLTGEIVVKVRDELDTLAHTDERGDKPEGIFIQRSGESSDEEKKGGELRCLARGHYGKLVWCRLQAADETSLRVDVLSEREGSLVKRLTVSEVSLSKIHSEDPEALRVLKIAILNFLSTAALPPDQKLTSMVNWLMVMDLYAENPSDAVVIESLKTTMGR